VWFVLLLKFIVEQYRNYVNPLPALALTSAWKGRDCLWPFIPVGCVLSKLKLKKALGWLGGTGFQFDRHWCWSQASIYSLNHNHQYETWGYALQPCLAAMSSRFTHQWQNYLTRNLYWNCPCLSGFLDAWTINEPHLPKKIALDVTCMWSHPLRRTCFGQHRAWHAYLSFFSLHRSLIISNIHPVHKLSTPTLSPEEGNFQRRSSLDFNTS